MSDSFKFQAKFPDIGLRGILKDISLWVGLTFRRVSLTNL